MLSEVDPEHLLRHVVVVQLVVTEGHVHVQGHVRAIFNDERRRMGDENVLEDGIAKLLLVIGALLSNQFCILLA